MEEIGQLWEDGEEFVANEEYHSALICFLKAKKLLITEAGSIFSDQKGGKIDKIYGEVMEKLSLSIENSVNVLNQRPTLALGLKRGYSMSDLKRAYHQMALRYHPDKNNDCDTSPIFTCIQTSYENLKRYMDRIENEAREARPATPPGQSRYPSTFDNSAPSSTPAPTKSTSTRSTSKFQENDSSAKSRSNCAELSTSQLREHVKKFGFGEKVNQMSREELVKKYLAFTAHLSNKYGSQHYRSSSDVEDSNKQNPDWVKLWAQEMRSLQDSQKSQTRRKRSSFEHQSSSAESKRSEPPSSTKSNKNTSNSEGFVSTPRDPKSLQRESQANESRKLRAERMLQELPSMTIPELKRMMMMSGLPTDACVEKADFLRRLCQYYGLDEMQLLNSDNSYDAREHNSSPSHSGAPSTKKTPEKTSAAENALRSKFADMYDDFSNTRPKKTDSSSHKQKNPDQFNNSTDTSKSSMERMKNEDKSSTNEQSSGATAINAPSVKELDETAKASNSAAATKNLKNMKIMKEESFQSVMNHLFPSEKMAKPTTMASRNPMSMNTNALNSSATNVRDDSFHIKREQPHLPNRGILEEDDDNDDDDDADDDEKVHYDDVEKMSSLGAVSAPKSNLTSFSKNGSTNYVSKFDNLSESKDRWRDDIDDLDDFDPFRQRFEEDLYNMGFNNLDHFDTKTTTTTASPVVSSKSASISSIPSTSSTSFSSTPLEAAQYVLNPNSRNKQKYSNRKSETTLSDATNITMGMHLMDSDSSDDDLPDTPTRTNSFHHRFSDRSYQDNHQRKQLKKNLSENLDEEIEFWNLERRP